MRLWICGALAILGALIGRGFAQTGSAIHEFDISASVQVFGTEFVFDFDSMGFPVEHPDGPGVAIESLRVIVVLDEVFGVVSPSSGDLISVELVADFGFAPSTTILPGLVELINETRTNGVATYPENPDPPTVLVYDFAPGNIPEGVAAGVRVSGSGVLPFDASGTATMMMRGKFIVIYNVGPATLLNVLDITGAGGGGIAMPPTLATVEAPQLIVDAGDAIGAADEVSGTVTVRRGGIGEPEPVVVGTLFYFADVIETSPGGTVNVVFIDESRFAMPDGLTIAIDEYIFDPESYLDPQDFSALKGVFVFTTGLISSDESHDSDSDWLNGSLGIRGRYPGSRGDGGQLTMQLVRGFRAQAEPFEISFDYAFVDPGMTLDVYMDSLHLASFGRGLMDPDPTDSSRATIHVDEESLQTLGPVLLRFVLTGAGGSEVLLDNVTGPGFTNPTFDAGADAWMVVGDGEIRLANVVYGELCRGSGVFHADQQLPAGSDQTGTIDPLTVDEADLNVDGKRDLVVIAGDLFGGGLSSKLSVFSGNGDGTFGAPVVYPLGAPVRDTRIVDLNRDGFEDVLFSSFPEGAPSSTGYVDGIVYMENDGSGALLSPVTLTQSPAEDLAVHSFVVLDADGNGLLDIFYMSSSSFAFNLLRAQEAGDFAHETSEVPAFIADAMVVADVDADGDPDVLAASSSGGIVVLINDGDGRFGKGATVASGEGTAEMLVADLDADGRLDLVQVHERADAGGVSVFLGDGAGGFVLESQHDLGLSVFQRLTDADIGDADNDGDLDLVVMTNSFTTSTVLLRNDGAGAFVEEPIPGLGGSSLAGRGVALLDTNRDGALDIAGDFGLADTVGTFLNGCLHACVADLAEPFGTLDFSDVFAFLVAFGSMDSAADLDEPFGVFDFSDVFAFLTAFGAGCH